MHSAVTHKSRWARWLALAIVIGLGLLAGHGASAATVADQSELTISPVNNRVQIHPGEIYTDTFTVLNSGTVPLDFRVYAAPYSVQGEQYTPQFADSTARNEIVHWISFSTTNYHLESREQVKVTYTVTAPASIPNGGQYAALFAETTDSSSQTIITKKRVGMLLYASAAGHTLNDGTLLSTRLTRWVRSWPVTLTQRIKNSGNTDFVATTTVTAKDIFGRTIGTPASNQHEVLPGTTRAVTTQLQHWPLLGIVRVHVATEFLGHTHTVTKLVFVAPAAVLIVAVLLLAIIVGGIVYVVRLRRAVRAQG